MGSRLCYKCMQNTVRAPSSGARFVTHGRVEPSGSCCFGISAYELEALQLQTGVLPEGSECPAAPQQPGKSPSSLICGACLLRTRVSPGPDVGQHPDEAVDFRENLAP